MTSRSSRARIRGAAAVTAVAAAIGTGAVFESADAAPHSAAPSTQTAGAPIVGAAAKKAAGATADVKTVTLITGEKVDVRTDAAGHATVTMQPGPDGSVPLYATRQVDGDQYVFPASATKALAAGTVDQKLFDVTALIAQGYDDKSKASIPVIAVYTTQASADSSRAARVRDAGTKILPSIHGVAFGAPKESVKQTFAGLVDAHGHGTGGLQKVWLDQKVHAALQSEDQQIGAPLAWAAGLTGIGVKVAVLDTGIDSAHPDLQGQVLAAQNFTADVPDTDVHDGVGHGTFVASEIAGTGTASGGAQRGVAGGAKLLVGKVLDDYGSGTDSQIIAGMQWASDSGADVASMSLGSQDPADCTDPMSVAAENLAETSKTLFVVAAGNMGRYESVSSPGCAADVLTVGAVDSADKTAWFSSRGSVQGAHTLKPEIAAPGVDVTGARAGGAGVYAYTAMSGTSMATPLVAGSAALVKQAHPDWTGAQIKAALVSSAVSSVPGDVQETGGGRLSVSAAAKQTVLGSPAVGFGTFAYPQVKGDSRTLQVPYTNTGSTPVTLTLALQALTGDDGSAITVPALAKLGATSVTVPAGATVDVPLTLDPAAHLKPGQFGDVTGRIVAAVSDGTSVSTPFNAYVAPQTLQVRVKVVDRNGKPAANATVTLLDLGQAGGTQQYTDANGEIAYQLRPGTFDLSAMVLTADPRDTTGNALPTSIAMMAMPEFKLTKDTVLTVDARQANRVEVQGDHPMQAQIGDLQLGRWWNDRWVDTFGIHVGGDLASELYLGGTGAAVTGGFEANAYFRMSAAQVTMTGAGITLSPRYPQYDAQAHLAASGSAQVVAVKSGSAADLAAAKGKIALVPDDGTDMRTLGDTAKAAGAVAVLVYEATPGTFSHYGISLGVPVFYVTLDEADKMLGQLAKGPFSLAWTSTPDSPFVYNLAFHDTGRVAGNQKHTVHDVDLAKVSENWYSVGTPTHMSEDETISRPWNPGAGFSLGTLLTAAPFARTEYFSADDSTWQHIAQSSWPFAEWMVDVARTYTAGTARTEDWYKGVIRPVIGLDPDGKQRLEGERQANQIGVDFSGALWGDANPEHYASQAYFGDGATVELFAGDQSLGASWWGPGNVWDVQPDAATYTLKLTQDRYGAPAKNWLRSTSIETDFTFSSHQDANAYSQSLPLLFPSYGGLALDGDNSVAAGPEQITLGATGQAGYTPPALTSAALSYSYDGGTTWTTAPTNQVNGQWIASVDHTGAAGKTVTVKLTLGAADGTSVTQTVVDAYGVK